MTDEDLAEIEETHRHHPDVQRLVTEVRRLKGLIPKPTPPASPKSVPGAAAARPAPPGARRDADCECGGRGQLAAGQYTCLRCGAVWKA